MSRMGYMHLFRDQQDPHTQAMNMIRDELVARGLARSSDDGLSIPLREDVRMTYLFLLAQEAREAGTRQGLDLHPTTNGDAARESVKAFLEGDGMPSRQDVVEFDLATASVDLHSIPLADVLGFRDQYRAEHGSYMKNLRRFMAEVSTAEGTDRKRLVRERQEELDEEARALRRITLSNFKSPKKTADFGIGLIGAAWTLATGSLVSAGIAALGVAKALIPDKRTGSAYSYIFRAHRHWH